MLNKIVISLQNRQHEKEFFACFIEKEKPNQTEGKILDFKDMVD